MSDKTDVKILLLERKEQWRIAQQAIIQLGNKIAVNDKNCIDIQTRLYEWSDEALAKSKECQAVLDKIFDD